MSFQSIVNSILTSVLTLFFLQVYAIEEKSNHSWLKDFMRVGLFEAKAKLIYPDTLVLIPNSEERVSEATVSIRGNCVTLEYLFKFDLFYTDKWSVLTNEMQDTPPFPNQYFVGSNIQPWAIEGDQATYQEHYERLLPNWMIFTNLDSTIIRLSEFDFPLSTLHTLFSYEELKEIRKAHKKDHLNSLTRFFTYDKKGFPSSFSSTYINKWLMPISDVYQQEVYLENKNGETIKVVPLVASKPCPFDGILLTNEYGSVQIVDYSINRMFNRFAPQIFRDPETVLQDFKNELAN